MGGTYIEGGSSITIDKNGFIYSTGIFTTATDFDPGPGVQILTPHNIIDVYIQKLDKDGNLIWVKNIGPAGSSDEIFIYGIETSPDGSIYLAGIFRGKVDFDPGAGITELTSNGYHDTYFMKLKSDGTFEWVRRIGGDDVDGGPDFVLDSAGNMYSTGSFYGTADIDPGPQTFNVTSAQNGVNTTAYVLKLDVNGNTGWVYPIICNNRSTATAITIDRYRHLYIAGRFIDSADFDPGPGTLMLANDSGRFFLQKIDTNANLVWAKNFFKAAVAKFSDICADRWGNLFLTGSFRNTVDFDIGKDTFELVSEGFEDAFVLKLNPEGSFRWAVSVGSQGAEFPDAIFTDKNGNVYSTGSFTYKPDFDPHPNSYYGIQSNGLIDAYIWKLSAYGNFIWARNMVVSGSGGRIQDIFVDKTTIYGTGEFAGSVDLDPGTGTHTLASNGSEEDIVNFSWNDLCVAPTTKTISVTECTNYTVPSGDETYTVSGTYKDTIGNVKGCDSIITINLTIIPPDSTEITAAECSKYTAPDGQVYTVSGIYEAVLQNSIGCDSVITIHLSINNTSETLNETACDSFISPSGNYTWTISGTYMDTIPNAIGCDSIITVNLTINTLDVSVTQNNGTLTANASGATYQWLDCANGYVPISGETNQSFIATSSGVYAVKVIKDGCIDTSACYTITGINEESIKISLFPNPTSGELNISLPIIFNKIQVKVINTLGQLVKMETFRDTNNIKFELPATAGLYTINIIVDNEKIRSARVVRK